MLPLIRNSLGAWTIIILVALGLPSRTLAAPPANDACSDALIIPAAGPFPYYTPLVPDITEATEVGDPAVGLDCPEIFQSVWYRFTPATTRLYTISAGTDTTSSLDDSAISVYRSSSGCAGPFTYVACVDDEAGLKAALTNVLQAGFNYYIIVSAVSLGEGSNSVQLRISTPVTPTNDVCSGAINIPSNGPFPYLSTTADTTLAATTGDPASSCSDLGLRGLWYRFVPSETTFYEFSTCTNTETLVEVTRLAVYAAPNGCGGALNQLVCDQGGCGSRAKTGVQLSAGTTYFILVWETAEQSEEEPTLSETLVQLRVAKLIAPVAITLPASSVSSSGALLNATINPNGLPTEIWFEWGTNTAYGSVAGLRTLPALNDPISVTAFIPDLTPGVTYHFRAVATNAISLVRGQDRLFTWSAAHPALSLRRLTNLTAEIRFQGNPGQTYWIEASNDLESWTNIGTAADPTVPGSYLFVDPAASILPSRFYRVQAP